MLKHEIKVFLFVGIITVIVDFLCYHLFLYFSNFYALSKASGFISGSLFAYFANKQWTFKYRKAAKYSLPRFALLYLITLIVNVLINSVIIKIFGVNPIVVQVAFLSATIISALINFFGMRLLVFNQKESI